MARIIPLHEDPHRQAQTLLPWRATGALNPEERAVVDAHLDECVECRRELKLEEALARAVSGLPALDETGWGTGYEGVLHPRRRPSPANVVGSGGLFRRRISIGLAFAAQAAMLAICVAAMFAWFSPKRPPYHAQASAPAPAVGNVVVIFKPTTSEGDLRAALVEAGARIVDGPTASDAYVLRVPPALRDAALARLRGSARVVLAEPLDGNDLR